MRVRLTVSISGTREGKDWPPVGAYMELPDDEARQMIQAGNAIKSDQRVGSKQT